MSSPIPISAGCAEYIPPHMDLAKLEKDGREGIQRLESQLQSLRNRAREGRADSEGPRPDMVPEINELSRQVSLEREGLQLDIKAVKDRYPAPLVFTLKIPTSIERDQINSRLIRLGLSNVSQQHMRATMIEELFEMDWGKGSKEANEAEAEDIANFLDGCWQRQEVHDNAIGAWEEQERERIMDEAYGAPARERAPLPPKIITVRELARMHLLVDRVMSESQRMRDLTAKATDFNRANSVLLFRIHVKAVRRGSESLPIEWDQALDVMTEQSFAQIREALDDVTWNDVVTHINNLYVLNGYEEKNSGSPLEKLPDQTGLAEQSGATGANGGNSTTSSITPVPADASATIIEQSSVSTSDSAIAAVTEPANDSPTAGA